MATKTIKAPSPLAPALKESLEFAEERLRGFDSTDSLERNAAACEVDRLRAAVAFWEVEDEKTAKAYQEMRVTLRVGHREHVSEPFMALVWKWMLQPLVEDPTGRGLGRVLLYAFPLRRLRNWRLLGALSHPENVAAVRAQLLGIEVQ